MITDIRVKLAAGLLLVVMAVLGSAQAQAAEPAAIRYQCDGPQSLVVVRSPAGVTVRFTDRTYELRRRRTSLGESYGSATAALIIDGTSAVFVADDRLQLGACVEAVSVAQLG